MKLPWPDPRKQRLRRALAFTLIEIVLAMGIVAISVLSIVGMLSTAATTSRDAGNDTVAVAIAQFVMDDLRVTSFDKLWTDTLYNVKAPPAPKTSVNDPFKDSVGYFTPEGDMMSPDPALIKERGWECVINKFPDPASQSVPEASPFNRMKVELVISRYEDGIVVTHVVDGKRVPKPTHTIRGSIARF